MDAELTSPPATGWMIARPGALMAALWGCAAGMNLFALFVVWRRVTGGIVRPLPAALLLIAGVVLGGWAWMSRHAGRALVEAAPAVESTERRWRRLTIAWAPSLAVVALTLGFSWPLDRLVDWFVWLPLWVADALWRQTFLAGAPFASHPGGNRGSRRGAEPGGLSPGDVVDADQEANEEGILIQQLTRIRNALGGESISGVVSVEFAPHQRANEVYVGFCPPFDSTPLVEFEQTEGPPARLSLGRALPHGARIDVRLAQEDPAVSHVYLDVFASG